MLALAPARTGRPLTVPPALLPLALGLVALGGSGPNPGLALLSAVALIAGTVLLWRPGESPILLFIFGCQWVQTSIAIHHASWLGLTVSELAPFGGDQDSAIGLSLAGLVVLAAGLRWGAGRWRRQHGDDARRSALSVPIRSWFHLYAAASGIGAVAAMSVSAVPGLAQPLLALANLKWAFYFMLATAAFVRGQGGHPMFLAAFCFELASGLGGFFSDFKTVLLVTLFALGAAGTRLSVGRGLGIGALAALLLALGIVWSSIKGDFRAFVAAGEATQAVNVDYAARTTKLVELVAGLDEAALADGADRLLRRLSYVEFFGVVLDTVPRLVPHESGAIWWDAVTRPFMPRLLFPDKTVIDDTQRTNVYTGGLAGTSDATSISLGHIAESYIDFGTTGMMAPLLLSGVLYGWIYRRLHDWSAAHGQLGMATATTILYGAAFLDSSITKSFGGVMVSLIVAWLVVAVAVPRCCPWLVADGSD